MRQILSTMAGNVWKIDVQVGEQLTAGQTIVILESMKMEIPIDSDQEGKVKSIKVEEGDFVNENDILVELE